MHFKKQGHCYCKRDLLLSVLLILIAMSILGILVTGGGEIQIAGVKINIYSIKYPFRVFLGLFALTVFLQKGTSSHLLRTIERLLTDRSVKIGLLLLALSIFIWIKFSQHYTFRTGAFDLSMYDYALSNTLKGNFMYTPWLGRSYFSEHFAPILLLLLPFYWVHDRATTLVVIQALVTVLAAIPLYKLAIAKLTRPLAACCIVIVYLNYRYVVHGFMFDFHMEIFEPLWVFCVFVFLSRSASVPYFCTLVLALMCKEDMPIYMFFLGVYACVREKKWKLGVPTMLLSLLWALLAWKVFIPMSYPDGARTSHFLERWGQYGQTYAQILGNLLTHPGELFGGLFLNRLKGLLSRLGYLPLADPLALGLALPPLLLNTTSSFDLQKHLQVHYALPVIPFVFIALVSGINNLCKLFPRKSHLIMNILCLYLLAANVAHLTAYPITAHDRKGHQLIAALPEKTTISAQTTIIPHLPKTQQIYLLPENPGSEYVFFDTQRFKWPMSDEEYDKTLQSMLHHPNYTLIAQEEGFYLFKKTSNQEQP